MASPLLTFSLVSLVIIAGITDCRWQKIPNWLTGSAVLWGMVFHLHSTGWDGLVLSLTGCGLGVLLFLILYGMGGMGAGDVKMLGAVGGMVGPNEVFWVFVMTVLLGGVYAVAMLCWVEGIKGLGRTVSAMGISILLTQNYHAALSSRHAQPKLRYGLVIGLGTMVVHLTGLGQ